jgi:ABC-type multidrug transport system ATPase subunit
MKMNFINGTLYKWYNDQVVFSGADISINSGEIYLVKSQDILKSKVFLEILADIDGVNLATINRLIDEKDISYLPEKTVSYKSMKVNDLITFYDDLYQNFDKKYADKWIEKSKIKKVQSIKSLSDIDKKTLGVIICLSFRVSLYVVNEPFFENDNLFIINILNTRHTESSTIIINTKYVNQNNLFTKVIDIKSHEKIEVYEYSDIKKDIKEQ